MKNSLSLKLAIIATTLGFLGACGGSSNSTPEPTTPPVQVSDTTPPVITLNGQQTMQLFVDDVYLESGATAIDETDGNVAVTVSGFVDTGIVGQYTVTYSASDAAGNMSSRNRVINVERNPALAFITTWDTTRDGVSEDNQIMIDTLGGGFDYSIDWGDGTVEHNVQGDIVHTYEVQGSYTITISGDFPHLYMAEIEESDSGEKTYFSDNLKLRTIEQWGDVNRRSMHASFRQTRITINATDTPDLSSVMDMSYMFQGAFLLDQFDEDIDLSAWDTSAVVNMSHLFNDALPDSFGLSEIVGFDKWNVGSVTNMSFMFANNEYANFNLNNWDLSNVTNMQGMFSSIVYFGVTFDQWNTSSVTNMSNMFEGTGSYSLPGRSSVTQWDVSNVTTMASMFKGAENFNDDISNWNVTNVSDMSDMFNLSATLTTEKYDALLLSWSAQQLKSDVHFHAGYSQYSTASQAARQSLIDTFNWTITDGGRAN